MNSNPCQSIQEEIAWGRPLNEEAQLHILQCEKCKKLSLQFSELDHAFPSADDVSIPEDFSARVMAKIKNENHASIGTPQRTLSWLEEKIGTFFHFRTVQITIALWVAYSMNRAF